MASVIRIVLLILSAVAILVASRRFHLSENIGYDKGALFLLLVGIQLLVAAALFHERHETHNSKPDHSTKDQEAKESDPPPKP